MHLLGMARLLFGKGSRGELVIEMQRNLLGFGLTEADLQVGRYGDHTVVAVTNFQAANGLPKSGAVDVGTWQPLMKRDIPTTFERALQTTAAMEGHGFTLAEGNFDGQGITWGIIGYTLKNGELGEVLSHVDPAIINDAFGPLADELRKHLAEEPADRVKWADSISSGKSHASLPDAWRNAFARLGSVPAVQQVQLDRARQHYGGIADGIVNEFSLKSELGYALAFDIAVQIGLKPAAHDAIVTSLKEHPLDREMDVRILIAHEVANTAASQFKADVLTRKSTFATGTGVVHGDTYVLANWGLGEFGM
jgi:peptidoglycan hydrolase-like protein with peptidoglycan-binding domain